MPYRRASPPAAASATAPAPPSNGRRLTGRLQDNPPTPPTPPRRRRPARRRRRAVRTRRCDPHATHRAIAADPAAAPQLALAACRALMRLPDARAPPMWRCRPHCARLRSGGASAPASPLVDLSTDLSPVGVRRASFDGEKQQNVAAASKAAAAAADDASASEGDEDEDEDESDWDDWDDDEEEAAAETQAPRRGSRRSTLPLVLV